MKSKLKTQYETADNLNARINLHEKYSVNKQGFHEWVFEKMNLKNGMKILECGCGPGALWYKNKKEIPTNSNVTLVDKSTGMLKTAKENIGDIINTEFQFIHGDVQKLPFDNNTFDIVIANHMLYHVEDIEKAISECKRVLKPLGSFFCSTFGKNHLCELNSLTRQYILLPKQRTSDRFCLENGCYIILKAFGNVLLELHIDALKVTNAQDLIDYILSSSYAQEQLVGKLREQFETEIMKKLANEKVINIMKDAGLFIAKK